MDTETCACYCDCESHLTETVERLFVLCTQCEDGDHYYNELS